MKNKKIIIVTIVIIVILITIAVIITSGTRKSNINSTNTENQALNQINDNYYYSTSNKEVMINEENTLSYKNNTFNSSEPNESVTIPSIVRIEQLLSNETWLKSNIYLKEDCFGNQIQSNVKQKMYFIKKDIETYEIPIIIIKVECIDANSSRCYALTYNNGEVKVNPLGDKVDHISHVEYNMDSTSEIIYKKTQYSDEETYDIYSISDKELKKISTISMKNKIIDSTTKNIYYYNENECTEDQYTNEKNKYINEHIKKEPFKELNSDTIKKNF